MKTTTKITIAVIINAILLLSIAYAAITNITLNIRGTVTADPSQANFKVKFTEPLSVSDSTKVIAAITDDTNATINVSGLTTKGESVSAIYTVHNISDDLSADLSVATTNSNTEYFTISSKLAKTSLKAGEATTVTVTVELTKTPVTGSVNSTIGVQLVAAPVEPGKEGTSGNVNDFSQTPEKTESEYAYLFDFDATTGTILGIKEEYYGDTPNVDYYENPNDANYSYVNGYGTCVLSEPIDTLVVPNEINGVAVKNVKNIGAVNVRKLVFEDGIESIESVCEIGGNGSDKLYYSEEIVDDLVLEEVVMPDSVTSIGDGAFCACTTLKSVTLGDAETSIGDYAFKFCSNLRDLEMPNVTSVGRDTFVDSLWYANHLEGVVYVGKALYKYKGRMPSQTNITVEDGTKSITSSAFYGITSLSSINIPSSVTSIGDYAFYGCTSLSSINIPDSVTSVGSKTFIGTAWYDAQSDGVIYVGKVLYKYKGTMPSNTSITVAEGIKMIGSSAFSNCKGLRGITIPASVTSIESSAFYGCTGLSSVNIPVSVTSIGSNAFEHCTSLRSINIPNSVMNIGSTVFGYWTESQTINCEATSKPSGWNSKWDYYEWYTPRKAQLNWGVSM